MVRRSAVIVLVVLLGACGSASLTAGDVEHVVSGGFGDAGVELTAVEVGDGPVDGSWPVAVQTVDGTIDVTVDAASGRIITVDFGTGALLEQSALESLAAVDDNPAATRENRRRTVVVLVGFVTMVAVGLGVARRLRLREEAALAADAVV